MPRSKNHTRRVARTRPRGVMQVNVEGYGFVRTSEGEFFVPASKLGGAFDGDVVEVAPLPANASRGRSRGNAESVGGGRFASKPAARVVCVVERAHDVVVGRYEIAEPFGVVVPLDPRIPYDIFTQLSEGPAVEDGALVRVRIAQFPSRNTAATGHIEEVLEHADGEDEGIDAVVARHKLEISFSPDALAAARAAKLDEVGALASGYRDLTGRFVFTIDPADARDFDDALSIERVTWEDIPRTAMRAQGGPQAEGACVGVLAPDSRSGGLVRIGVHIADVSHYVDWGSALDLDARRRATSVYLADRVIPMIPEELSCGLCSLAPGQTRRSMTADLYVNAAAQLVGYEIYPALIRSDARLTYDEALESLQGTDGEPVKSGRSVGVRAGSEPASAGLSVGGNASCSNSPARTDSPLDCPARAELRVKHPRRPQGRSAASYISEPEYQSLESRLRALSRIAQARRSMRERKGGIDFDQPEAKVRLDDAGKPVEIVLRRKNEATELVEEMMIWANEVVARHLQDAGFPCAYRVHEAPDLAAVSALVPIFEEFPWFQTIDAQGFFTGDQRALQAAVRASRGRAEGELVSSLALRAMKRAVYRPENCGHFGLVSDAYCHFTSPIRRYPDLMVHRMLKAQLFGRPEKFDQMASSLGWICEHSSTMEREADDAARESQELKIAEYLQPFVGQSFPAIVSGVSQGGLYARLENTAEGFIPVRTLGDDYFSFDPARHTLSGEETGARYRLGQRIAVVLYAVDARVPQIDLRLAQGRQR